MEEDRLNSSGKDKEFRELEKLALKFGKNSGIIDIQGDFVYGYINNKRVYLMSLAEYSRYKKLRTKYHKKSAEKNEIQEKEYEEHESNIKAYRCFLEHDRSVKSHNP